MRKNKIFLKNLLILLVDVVDIRVRSSVEVSNCSDKLFKKENYKVKRSSFFWGAFCIAMTFGFVSVYEQLYNHGVQLPMVTSQQIHIGSSCSPYTPVLVMNVCQGNDSWVGGNCSLPDCKGIFYNYSLCTKTSIQLGDMTYEPRDPSTSFNYNCNTSPLSHTPCKKYLDESTGTIYCAKDPTYIPDEYPGCPNGSYTTLRTC